MSDLVRHQPQEPPRVEYLGFPARVDLLPKEVRERVAMRGGRRLAVLLVVLALVLVGAGTALGWTSLLAAQAQLAASQARTLQLTSAQGDYQAVRDLQADVAVGDAAVRVGSATAIGWVELMGHLTAGMPADAVLGAVTIDVQSPIVSVAQSSQPLVGPRIGQIQLTATGPDLAALTYWLDGLRADPEFSGIEVASAVDSEGWLVTLTASVSPALTALPEETEGSAG